MLNILRSLPSIMLIIAGIYIFTACDSNPYKQGAILYTNFCTNCHMEDGSGLQGLIPPLAQADYLQKYPEKLPCIIRYGLKDTIIVNGQTYSQEMAGIPELNEVEIGNIINYINHAWGNENPFVPPKQIEEYLENCPTE